MSTDKVPLHSSSRAGPTHRQSRGDWPANCGGSRNSAERDRASRSPVGGDLVGSEQADHAMILTTSASPGHLFLCSNHGPLPNLEGAVYHRRNEARSMPGPAISRVLE